MGVRPRQKLDALLLDPTTDESIVRHKCLDRIVALKKTCIALHKHLSVSSSQPLSVESSTGSSSSSSASSSSSSSSSSTFLSDSSIKSSLHLKDHLIWSTPAEVLDVTRYINALRQLKKNNINSMKVINYQQSLLSDVIARCSTYCLNIKETELLSTYDLVNQCIEDSFVLENGSSVARLEELHYRIISPNLRSDANIILQSITAKPQLKPKAVILRSSLRHVKSFMLELTTDIPIKFQKKGAMKIMEHRVCERVILL